MTEEEGELIKCNRYFDLVDTVINKISSEIKENKKASITKALTMLDCFWFLHVFSWIISRDYFSGSLFHYHFKDFLFIYETHPFF